MLSLCSLRSHNTTLVRLAARPRFARSRFARLLCSLRSPPRSTTLTCALASLVPAASPACFARLAGCSLRSTRLSRCSLRSSSLLPSLASLGPLLLFARSARCLACCALASLVSSPAARSARRLDCDSLCSPLAALPAVRSSLAVYLIDLLARLTRLARFACSSISPHSTGRAGFAELTRQKSSERDGQKMSAIQRVESDPEIPDPSRACLVFQRSIVPPRAACACASRSAGGL